MLLPLFYQQQHCRQRRLSADVDHGKYGGPVALSGPHKQHPAAQKARFTLVYHTTPPPPPAAEKLSGCSAHVPGRPKEAPVQRPQAGQGHQKGDQGRRSLQGAVGKCLQVKISSEIWMRAGMLSAAQRPTDHSHGLGPQQLGRAHHGVVGHVDEDVKHRHRHHGPDYGHWDCSGHGEISQK